jgi:myo-inositol-1(or 4)-monophosphatase
MQPSLDLLVQWAAGAGQILRDGYGKQHIINRKGRIDLVTEMDHQSEAYLLEQIRARFPSHTIDSEESGRMDGAEESCWYIDPLDGTTNYAHNIPIFSVSIAYARAGQVQMGVVYDPMRDECFTAERGKGAFCNGQQLTVSNASELSRALLVTGFPYEVAPGGQDNLAQYAHFSRLSEGVRRLGSAAIDLCYVAAGRFDGYWELTLRAWDLAAGALIVEEAGGRVSKVDGSVQYLYPPHSIVAGTPVVYEQMLRDLQKLNGTV